METKNQPITRLYDEIMQRHEVRALIPMGYVPGMPVLTVKAGQLVAVVPFLRYKVTGEVDRTLVFPVRYVLEYLMPERQVVGFADLSVDDRFEDVDFNEPVGFFRHEAIRHLDRKGYEEMRQGALGRYDRLISALVDDDAAEYTADDDAALRADLQALVEPSLLGTYSKLDSEFYDKYLSR